MTSEWTGPKGEQSKSHGMALGWSPLFEKAQQTMVRQIGPARQIIICIQLRSTMGTRAGKIGKKTFERGRSDVNGPLTPH